MKYLKALLLFVCTFIFTECTEKFDEINTQPGSLLASSLTETQLGQAFAQAQYNTMHGLHWRFQISENLFSDLFAQYFATTAANFDSDRHVEVGRWIDLCWSSFYGEAAPQIKYVEDFSKEKGLDVENAIVKIWRVQGYHRITDYWGPTIYSEFGNGKTSVGYDTQESIYKSFFTTLDEAVAVLKANAGKNAFGNNDQVFNGNVDQWLKFANSLRLRLAIRIKYADATLAKTQAEKAIADGVITANTDNASMLTTPNSRNPFTTITDWGEFRMSAAMESTLKGYADPRMSQYFSPAANGDKDGDGVPYEGLRNGLLKVDKVPALNGDNSDMAAPFLNDSRGGKNPRIKIMSASEVYFLKAEGALEGWNMGGGTAQSYYEMGIETSLKEWTTASQAVIDAYKVSPNVPADIMDAYNSGAMNNVPILFKAAGTKEEKLEQIITQKWLGLFPDGWEAWAELRRTGYPRLYPRLFSDNLEVPANAVMRRVKFVLSEFSNNKAAVEAAQQLPELVGGDKNNTKVWWDRKP
jgi:Susd and RagB outer membrane lipoprotein